MKKLFRGNVRTDFFRKLQIFADIALLFLRYPDPVELFVADLFPNNVRILLPPRRMKIIEKVAF